jgi:hypothetical protein
MFNKFEIDGVNYELFSEGNSYEMGYGVRFINQDGARCLVQFGVLLTSSMEPAVMTQRVDGPISHDQYEICKNIAAQEVATNPTVFHIVTNGRHEQNKLKAAIRQSLSYKYVDETHPEMMALQNRVDEFEKIISASTNWAHTPDTPTFKEFLDNYRAQNFMIEPLMTPEGGAIDAPMSPYDLTRYAREISSNYSAVGVIRSGESLSVAPDAVGTIRGFEWPLPYSFLDDEPKWLYINREDFNRGNSERVQDVLSRPDTLLVVWSRRGDRVSLERIASVINRPNYDPHVVIGTPDGTISGRASSIKLAMQASAEPEVPVASFAL